MYIKYHFILHKKQGKSKDFFPFTDVLPKQNIGNYLLPLKDNAFFQNSRQIIRIFPCKPKIIFRKIIKKEGQP